MQPRAPQCGLNPLDDEPGAGVTIWFSPVREEETTTNRMQEGAESATAERGARPLDRVTAPDLMLIWPEEEGWPQGIGALAMLDGRSLFDAGEFQLGAVRETVGRRLHLVPRFRQVLYWPRLGLGWPVWGDAQSFDITQHVRTYQVPPPGEERHLLLACERLRRRSLHRGRPLWEMWFLTGLAEDRVGFFIKMHHAMPTALLEWLRLPRSLTPSPTHRRISRPRESCSRTTCAGGWPN